MSTVTEKQLTDAAKESTPKEIHFSRPPYTHALCGRPRDGEPLKPGVPATCVVCRDLAAGLS